MENKAKESVLTPQIKAKIEKLPYLFRVAAQNLVNALDSILNGECDESEIVNTLTTLNNNVSNSYTNDDLVNYDKAGKMLGISNRAILKQTLNKNGIDQVVMNNKKIGFPRSKVLALRSKLFNLS